MLEAAMDRDDSTIQETNFSRWPVGEVGVELVRHDDKAGQFHTTMSHKIVGRMDSPGVLVLPAQDGPGSIFTHVKINDQLFDVEDSDVGRDNSKNPTHFKLLLKRRVP